MTNIQSMIKKWNITRAKLEIFSVIVILVCALSVFGVRLTHQTSLTYEQGKMRYTGYVVNHKMNGKGKLIYPNGDTYVGTFKNGVFEGEGTLQLKQAGLIKVSFIKVKQMVKVC